MGVEYRGVMIVGYTRAEFEQCVDNTDFTAIMSEEEAEALDFQDKVECLGIARVGPYYDADSDDCIYGDIIVRSGTYSVKAVDPRDMLESIAMSFSSLQQGYGLIPKLYIIPQGF